jgi:NADH-quinone oxidoreductase subunit N
MSELIQILPVLTVLVAALALMFMSMYESKFSTKTYIATSSVILVAALIMSFIPS